MALEKATVHLNLGSTLDQKDDNRVSDQNAFKDLKDWVWNKLKRLDKRPGTDRLTTEVVTPFPNPLSIGPSAIKSGTFAHNDQLCLQNKGALYTYSEDLEEWRFIGHQYPVEVNSETVVSNEGYNYQQNVGKLGNLLIHVYTTTVPGGTSELRYTVIDQNDGARLVYDRFLSSLNPNTILFPKVITFQNSAFIAWQENANLFITQIDANTGLHGSITSLKNDVLNSTTTSMDWTYTNKPGVGERVFIVYYGTGNTRKLFAITNTGAVDATIGTNSIVSNDYGYGIHYEASFDRIYIGSSYVSAGANFYRIEVISFTSSSITVNTTINNPFATQDGTEGAGHSFTFCRDPINPTRMLMFFDTVFSSGYAATPVYLANIFMVPFTNASASAYRLISKSLLLTGKAIPDTTLRNTVYLVCEYSSPQNGASFVIDVFRGKTFVNTNTNTIDVERAAYTVSKVLPGEVVSYSQGSVVPVPLVNGARDVILYDSNQYLYTCLRKTAISSIETSLGFQAQPVYTTGVVSNVLNLTPDFTASTQFLNNGTHITGGYLGYFDGSQFSEHGFLLPPDYIEASSSGTNNRVMITVFQQGDASHPEITFVSFLGGAAMLPGPAYWTFNSTAVQYYVWYRINGVGTDPAVVGKTGIVVDIYGNESGAALARKTMTAVNAAAFPTQVSATATPTQPQMIITNANNGSVTDASSANFQNPTIGPAAGTYQYVIVWNYIDANGNVFRSATSTPVSIVTTGAFPTFVNFMIPPVTNRPCEQVGVEIYRTSNAGTTFRRITPFPLLIRFNADRMSYSYTDTKSDSQIANGEILYTTGGIIDNFSIPACKNISLFKERLIVSGMDQSTVYYSKTAIINSAVEFGEELFIALAQDGQKITGHDQMDDKLVIGKEKKIIYYGGDGANELGQNSTFSQPVTVASDVGAVSQNSFAITPNGLFFRSRMGIQLLNRATQVLYPGISVKDYNEFRISRALVLKDDEEVREIRFVLDGADFTLVYNYLYDLWTVFSNYGGTDACLWKGHFVRCDGDGYVYVESNATFVDQEGITFESYDPIVETNWLKLKNVQDFQRVWRLSVLGDLKSPHNLVFEVQYDYDETNTDTYTFSSANIGGVQPDDTVYQPQIHLKRQKCQAIKVKMTVVPNIATPGTEECLSLIDLAFSCGVKRGLNKVKASKKL